MAQQFIDFGTFPNDPSADPIRSAFQKIQNNFTDLYNATITAGVSELVVGPGLSQNRTIGNLYITANIPNITIQTSNNLLVGVGAATGNSATISSYNTPFVLNLANTITTINANLTGNVRTANLQVTNFVSSALTPNANITYDLGTPSNRWRDAYLGNTIVLGPQTIGANASGVTFSNVIVSSNITVGNITSGGNSSLGNLAVTGVASVTGNIIVGNISTSRIVTTANANIGGNLNVTGNANVGNIQVSGVVYGNLIPATAELQNLGSESYPWKDLFLSGNTLKLGTQSISSNASGIIIPSAVITNSINAGNVVATYVDGTLTASNQPLITSLGNLTNLKVEGNLQTGEMTVAGNLEVDSNLKVTGSLETQTIVVTQIITPPNVEVTLSAPGSNSQIMFNDDGNIAAVSGMTFDKANNILSIQGNVEGGNVVTSGAIVGNTANFNSLDAATITATGDANVGNLITVGILASTANLTGDLNTQGFLTVVGNANVGNITTTTVNGVTVSVSGEVSGANLVASGVLRVDGNANVGNLTTSGLVSAATMEASGLTVGANLQISAIVGNGTVVKVTFPSTGNIPFPEGKTVIIKGVTPVEYNGTFTVLTGNATQVTYDSTANATADVSEARITTGGSALNVKGAMSVEELSGNNLSSSGNLTVAGNSSLGIASASSLSATGNVSGGNLSASGDLSVTGNAVTGNLQTSLLTASGTVTGGNLSTTGLLSAGNASLGNITSVGLVSASGNVTAGNLDTGGTLLVTGNANTGNLGTESIVMNGNLTGAVLMESGLLNVTGNMTGGNVITNGFLSVAGTATIGNVVAENNLTIQRTATVGTQVQVGSNLAIATATGDGSTMTITFAEQAVIPFPDGTSIVVTGCTPSSFNGTYTVVDGTTTEVTVSSSVSGAASGTGRIYTGGTGLTVTGNATISNMEIAGLINAATGSANIGAVTSGILSVTGNASAGNLETSGTLSVNGNAITGNFTANGTVIANGALTVQSSAVISSALNVGANISLSSIGGTGSVVTATFATQSYVPFPVGSTIVISGVTPAGYNGSYTVVSATTSQVTYSSSVTGTASVLGRIITGGTALNIRGNANVTNLNVASFTGTDAALTNLTFASSGILNLASGNANIGNIATAILDASSNISAGNLYSRGILTVDGNVNASRITVANAIATNNYAVGGQITIGSSLTATGASGTGSVVTLTFAVQTAAPFPPGSTISVTGMNPAAYNGTFSVTSCNTTHVTYSSTATGSFVSGGTIKSSGTGLVLQSVANVGGLNTTGNVNAGNVSGGTFTATLFSGNGASITGINVFNTSARVIVTGVAGTGSVCTLTYPEQSFAPFTIGQSITVAGVTPTAYNGTFTVVTSNTTTVTFTHTATGSSGFVSGAGTITGGPKAESALVSNQVISNNQPNITSVGILTGLTLNGGLSGTDISSSGFVYVSVGTGITATGTNQSTATALTKQVNLISGGTAGTGVRLPSATVGMQLIIINATGAAINVYPASSAQIDSLSTNASFPLGIGSRLMVVATGTTQWYTMVGVYG